MVKNSLIIKRALIALSIITLITIGFFAYNQYNLTHKKGEENARITAERIVHMLNRHAELTFTIVEGVVERTIERRYIYSLLGKKVSDAAFSNLEGWIQKIPAVTAVVVSNTLGGAEYISTNGSYSNANIETIMGPYITALIENESIEGMKTHIDVYDLHEDSASRFIVISRALYDLKNNQTGLISVMIDSNYFTNFFHSINLGEESGIAMVFDNGGMLTANIHSIEDMRFIKNTLADAALAQQLGPQRTEVSQSTLNDDKLRLLHYKHQTNLPLTLAVIFHEHDIFASAISLKKNYLGFLAVVVGLVTMGGIVAYLLMLNIRKAENSERSAIIANQTKSEFLARMSHEFRTPLNAIIGFSEIMKQGTYGPLNEEQQARVNDMHECGVHLLAVVNDILDFSKAEAGKLQLNETEVHVDKSVKAALKMIEGDARNKNIRIINNAKKQAPIIKADERKIRQILLNLLSNAVKFTEEKGTVIINAFTSENGDCVIQIKDTGVGMDKKDIPKAISVFGQVVKQENQEKLGTSNEGTGLGLPLCKMFAEIHGGSLYIESAENIGTKITVTIPNRRVLKSKQPIDKKEKTV